MAEIDDTQLASLREVAGLMEKLWSHPEARKMVQKAIKTQNPNAAIPEMEAKAEVLEELEREREARLALEKEFKADKEARELDRQRAQFEGQWEAERRALRNAGYLDDGIAKIEEHAKKFGIPSLEVAAAHWEKLNPPQQVVTPSGGSWNFFDTPDASADNAEFMKAMMDSRGDNEIALDREIRQSLSDYRNQNQRAR